MYVRIAHINDIVGVNMNKRYYITTRGELTREKNTLYYLNDNQKVAIPIEKVKDIFANEGVSMTHGVFKLASEHSFRIFVFSYSGKYLGKFSPIEPSLSGKVTIEQADKFLSDARIEIAKSIVYSSMCSMISTCNRYLDSECTELNIESEIQNADRISDLMGFEGQIRERYYERFDDILLDKYNFSRRAKNPPKDIINSLISYVNALIYASVSSEIYKTRLSPEISFLHAPSERRESLCLDIADIFKPLIGDRVVFELLNQGILNESHFIDDEIPRLTQDGKNIVHNQFEDKMSRTQKHPRAGRNVSWQRWIELEAYALCNFIIGTESEYNSLDAREIRG